MTKSDRLDAVIILLLFTLIVGGVIASHTNQRLAAIRARAVAGQQ